MKRTSTTRPICNEQNSEGLRFILSRQFLVKATVRLTGTVQMATSNGSVSVTSLPLLPQIVSISIPLDRHNAIRARHQERLLLATARFRYHDISWLAVTTEHDE